MLDKLQLGFKNGDGKVINEDLGVDLEADEGQFANFSVDDDDSNQEDDLMANFGIEVESEGGFAQYDEIDVGFKEADFKLFQ